LHPYVIREGGASDIDQCARLANLAAPERDLSDWRVALQRDVEFDSHWLVVAEIDDTIIAYGRTSLTLATPPRSSSTGSSASKKSLRASPSPARRSLAGKGSSSASTCVTEA